MKGNVVCSRFSPDRTRNVLRAHMGKVLCCVADSFTGLCVDGELLMDASLFPSTRAVS